MIAASLSLLLLASAKALPNAVTLIVLALMFVTGCSLELSENIVPSNQLKRLLDEARIQSDSPMEITGVLDDSPQNSPDGFYLILHVERVRSKEGEQSAAGEVGMFAPVRLREYSIEYAALNLQYGTRIRVRAKLDRSNNFRNPGVSSFTEYLDRKGFDATALIKDPRSVERLGDAPVFPPMRWISTWRDRLEVQINRTFSTETAGVLLAAFLGNRYFLSRAAAERFRAGGTFHVLVISGLQITVVGGLVLLLVRRLSRNRWVQFLCSATLLWAYAVAVGGDASVVRAALMFSFVALAPVVWRQARSLNTLAGAALILLVWRPAELFDPSFQLTFVSVFAIIALAVPLLKRMSDIGGWRPAQQSPYPPNCSRTIRCCCEALYWRQRAWTAELAGSNYQYRLFKSEWALWLDRYRVQALLRFLISALIVTASVQLTMLPIQILYFHRLSPSSFVLNIIVSVLMAVLAITALLTLLLAPISAAIGAWPAIITNGVNWAMVHSVDPFTIFNLDSIRLPEYSEEAVFIYVLYYVPLLLLIRRVWQWNPVGPPTISTNNTSTSIAIVGQLLLVSIVLFHPLSAGFSDDRLRVDFLDVGQGDSALVTMPNGSTLLVDGGGKPLFRRPTTIEKTESSEDFQRDTRSIGEAVVSEYLWWRGLDRIDYLLATHADADHIDGLSDVARNFQVRAAFVARTPAADPEYQRFATTMNSEKVPITLVAAGDELQFDSATLDVLWPKPASADAPSRNNDSIVMRVALGERAILMTGDIEKAGEAAMLSSGANVAADVIKVPHHGSRTSSTAPLEAACHPSLAVISVGLTSMFGHPHREVVESWSRSGAMVLTTGKCGTITITTDGHDMTLRTFIQCPEAHTVR